MNRFKRNIIVGIAFASAISFVFFAGHLMDQWRLSNDSGCDTEKNMTFSDHSSDSQTPSMVDEQQEGTWINLSRASLGWPEEIGIRTLRGLEIFQGNVLVGPRTDHGPCGERYPYVLSFDGDSWQIIAGSENSHPWADARIDRVNQIKVLNGRAYFALGAQFRETGAAAIAMFDGHSWYNIAHGDHLSRFSAVMTLASFGDDLVGGAIAPGVRGPGVIAFSDNGARDISPSDFERCNSSWIFDMIEFMGDLYVATLDSNDFCIGGVWRFDGQNWSYVAGDGQLGSWSSPVSTDGFIGVNSLVVDGNRLFASASSGTAASIFPAWRFNGHIWSAISPETAPVEMVDRSDVPAGNFFDFIDVIDGAVIVGGSYDFENGPPIWIHEAGQWRKFDRSGIDRLVNENRSTVYFYDMDYHDGQIFAVLGSEETGGGDVWRYRYQR